MNHADKWKTEVWLQWKSNTGLIINEMPGRKFKRLGQDWTYIKEPPKTRGDKNQIKKPMSPTSMNTWLLVRL